MLTFLFATSKVTNWVDAIGVVLKIEARKQAINLRCGNDWCETSLWLYFWVILNSHNLFIDASATDKTTNIKILKCFCGLLQFKQRDFLRLKCLLPALSCCLWFCKVFCTFFSCKTIVFRILWLSGWLEEAIFFSREFIKIVTKVAPTTTYIPRRWHKLNFVIRRWYLTEV